MLKAELQKFKEINALVLFGSFAREDYSVRHSDIDLMVFIDTEKKDTMLEEKVRKSIIKHSLGKLINIHAVFQYKKVDEEDRSLMLTVAREGRVMFAKKTIVLSYNILGLKPFVLLRFNTAGVKPVAKNRLQRFLYGYKIKGKQYKGIIDGENVLSAGQGAIILPEEMVDKITLFARHAGIDVVQKGKFYR